MQPVFETPCYVAFILESGVTLSLWTGHLDHTSQEKIVSSTSAPHTGQVEISFMLDTETEVDNLYAAWIKAGVQIIEPLAIAVFGKTFVADDPDAHSLRVCLRD